MSTGLTYSVTGSGTPMVLLHAFPMDARMWDAQRHALADRHTVITPNFHGFGGSPLGDQAPSIDLMASDVLTLTDRLGLEHFALGGLSMGGYVAMGILRQRPEAVTALALVDTKASADTEAARANRERIAATVESEQSTRVLVDDVLPGLLGASSFASRPDVVANVRAVVEAAPIDAVAWAQRAMAGRPESFDVLARFEGPSLVVVGSEDAVTPLAEAQLMNDALQRSNVHVIEGAGHLSALEHPGEVTNALRGLLR